MIFCCSCFQGSEQAPAFVPGLSLPRRPDLGISISHDLPSSKAFGRDWTSASWLELWQGSGWRLISPHDVPHETCWLFWPIAGWLVARRAWLDHGKTRSIASRQLGFCIGGLCSLGLRAQSRVPWKCFTFRLCAPSSFLRSQLCKHCADSVRHVVCLSNGMHPSIAGFQGVLQWSVFLFIVFVLIWYSVEDAIHFTFLWSRLRQVWGYRRSRGPACNLPKFKQIWVCLKIGYIPNYSHV